MDRNRMTNPKTTENKPAVKPVAKAAAKPAVKPAAPKAAPAPKKEVAPVTPKVAAAADAKKITPVKKGEKVVSPDINGVGRRKSSVARVWLSRGKGDVLVNGRAVGSYFTTDQNRFDAVKPLIICGVRTSYNIKANVNGGGPCSQADAVKLGIARALLKYNETFRELLRQNGLLTVDARVKERKKPGQAAARRKFQFVKR